MLDAVPPDLARALAERYDLRDILGRGGMATVYMAYDRKHQREVALKCLRPDIAATIGADRFLKEIQIVARMVHPHILPLHDSGEVGGFVYYVTPFIDGGSLRTCIEREGRMAPERAIGLATPIADAPSYAHQMGVLHRDIKPENVLFARSHPIVADFGIAKAVSSATSGAQLTRTGISLGTPGYMSPEQAAGFTDVDARTDVYSLAILVYALPFIIPMWFGIVYGVARSSYFYAVKCREKALGGLADRLADLARELIGEPLEVREAGYALGHSERSEEPAP